MATLAERVLALNERGLDFALVSAILDVAPGDVEKILEGKHLPVQIEREWVGLGSMTPGQMVTDGRFLIYGAYSGSHYLGRVALTGGEWDPRFIGVGAREAEGVAISDEYLFWTAYGVALDSVIGRSRIDGSEAEPEFLELGEAGSFVYGCAYGGSALFYIAEPEEGKKFLGLAQPNAAPPKIYNGEWQDTAFGEVPFTGASGGLAFDGHHWFWTQKNGEGEFAIAKMSGEPPEADIEFEFCPVEAEDHGVTVHDGYVYFTHPRGEGGIGRIAVDGSDKNLDWLPGDPDTEEGGGANGIVFHDRYVYWASHLDGQAHIGRAVIP